MYIFQVHHYIKPEMAADYLQVTLENAAGTIREPGVIRFDVFQDTQDPTHFSLLEVYRDLEARDVHLQTPHFLKWKEVYLATQSRKGHGDEFNALFPPEAKWLALK